MREPRWLSRRIIDHIHAELIAEHGGSLARPHNRHAHDRECDLADLAAAYLFGFVRNHGFVDGNKQVGLAAAAVFLEINDAPLLADEAEVYTLVMDVAAGKIDEPEAAAWIRAKIRGA